MAGFPANRDITEILIRYASYRLLLYRKGVTVQYPYSYKKGMPRHSWNVQTEACILVGQIV